MVEQIASMNINQVEQQAKLLELNSDIANSQSEIEKMRRRTDTLRGLLLSPEDITNRGTNPFAKGSFGQIYSGSFKTAHNKIAIKVIQNTNLSPLTPRQVQSAEGEVLLLDGLKYISIVVCYGYLFDPKKFTIVMELAPFGSLWDLLDDFVTVPSIPFTLSVTWMTTLCDALVHIHSKGVVHKDLKCENLLVFHGLAVKLCDFGLAKHDTAGAQSSITGAGTDRFMAPEVRLKHHATSASDVYSFSTTALQMLRRAAPEIYDVEKQIAAALHAQTLSGEAQGAAEMLDEVLASCVQSSPNKRHSAAEVLTVMSSISQQLQKTIAADEGLVHVIEGQVDSKYRRQNTGGFASNQDSTSRVHNPSVTSSKTGSFGEEELRIIADLVEWMRRNAPSVDASDLDDYAQLMFVHKVRTIARLTVAVQNTPSFLESIGIPKLDADDITTALVPRSTSPPPSTANETALRLESAKLLQQLEDARKQQEAARPPVVQAVLTPPATPRTENVFQKNYPVGTYVGQFQDGNPHGKGRMTYNTGDVYNGEWRFNQMSGEGMYTFKKEGEVYA
eukprot:gene37376-46114_t